MVDWATVAETLPTVLRSYVEGVATVDPLTCVGLLARDPRFETAFGAADYRERLLAAGYDLDADWRAVWQQPVELCVGYRRSAMVENPWCVGCGHREEEHGASIWASSGAER